MLLYFAYGSNLDLAQMRRRCPESRTVYPGQLPNYRLTFNRYSSVWKCGVADIVEDRDSDVWGLVYKISDSDLHSLDRYEGYPTAYTRFQTRIHTEVDILGDVWVYTVCEKGDFIAPGPAYLGIIQKAAEECAFPAPYRKMLERIAADHP